MENVKQRPQDSKTADTNPELLWFVMWPATKFKHVVILGTFEVDYETKSCDSRQF